MKKIHIILFLIMLIFCLKGIDLVNVNASTYTTNDEIKVIGAQIRTKGNAGIRFVGSIGGYDDSNVKKYGFVLAFGVAYANEKFVIDGTVNNKIVANAEVNSVNDNGYFYVNLYDIPQSQYGQLVSVRSYVKEGESIIYSSTVVIRSLAQVAFKTIEDGQSNEYLESISQVIDTLYKEVEVSFDSDQISFVTTSKNITSDPTYTIDLEIYNNGLYNNGQSVYLDDFNYLTSSTNKSSFIYSNKVLLKYDETYDAYKIVAQEKSSSSGTNIKNFSVEWDYSIMYMTNTDYESVAIGQYVVFDKELEVGITSFKANVYNEEDFVANTKIFKIPEVLPLVTNETGLTNTAWVSSLDNNSYVYYPGYNDSEITSITYSPIWYSNVTVTLDYAGNLGYDNRIDMVSDFVEDFNSYSGRSVLSDGSDFFDRSWGSGLNLGYTFLTDSNYVNKWGWLLEYINSVRNLNNKTALTESDNQAYPRAEIHNFLTASNANSNGCDYSSEEIANGYLKLDEFKKESLEFLYPCDLPLIERSGYEFLGWVSSLDGQIYTSFNGYYDVETITYKAKWETKESITLEEAFNCVSDVVTSNTVDTLLSEYEGYSLEFSSSNESLYTISNGQAYANRLYQTHKVQTVTVTLVATLDSQTVTITKDIQIDPVLFDEMTNPKAVYFATSAMYNYINNSNRYKEEGTIFSEKFRENMDMVYYAFANPQSDGTLSMSTTYLNKVLALKQDGIRVLLVINGAVSENLQAMVQLCDNDETRATFVENIMSLVTTYNFDGVDIDWEFPGTSGLDSTYYTTQRDQANLNKLLRDLREALDDYQDDNGSPYILSCAIPASSWGSIRYDFTGSNSQSFTGDNTLGGIDTYCDYVNMMSYDVNHSNYTSHVASCYYSLMPNDYKFGCVYGANRFISLGLSPEKVIIGAAAYGKTFKITGTVDESATYPGLGVEGTLTQISGVTGSNASGTIFYTGISELLANKNYRMYTEYNNGKLVGSYLYSSVDQIFVTFDSEEAIIAKCEYAKESGYGIMVWAYGEDATDTLVDTICDNLK